jgi:acyl carrier protein
MEKETIKEILTNVFRSVFGDSSIEVTEGLSANDVSQWDSLTHMVLITAVEKEFNITFKLKELNKMQNVGDMIELIDAKKSV